MRPALAALALVLVSAGATGCAVGADASGPSGDPGATPTPVSSGTPQPAAEAKRVGSIVPQVPNEIEIPDGHKLGVHQVSTKRNGLLDVPSNIESAGWWRGGSKIGDPFGSTLIAAHVDSFTQGLGPFASLLSAHRGDTIYVWSRGLRQTFRVTSLRLRPRSTVIGAEAWLHSPQGPRRLTLVTCAGPYVPAQGGYQNLAVITATPVGDPISRSGS